VAYEHYFTGKSRLLPMSESPSTYETEITFTIPSQTRFQSLQKTDINAEEVESAPVEDMPPFLQKFRDDLARQRCVPVNVSAVATSLCFPLFFFLTLHSHHSSQLFPVCFTGLADLSVTIFGLKIKHIQFQTW
jgi:hypothetical protein